MISLAVLLLLGTLVSDADAVEAGTDQKPTDSPLQGTAPDRIIAFGDVHGGATELQALLRALTLIDQAGNWTGGQTRLVSLGDLLDRGPNSRAVMDLLMTLEEQAAQAGGAVHLVLGNHELMNLTGDLRYVSEAEYAAFRTEEDPTERNRAFTAFQAELAAEAPPAQVNSRLAEKPEVDPRAAFAERFPPGYFAHRAAFAPDGTYGRWLLGKPQILVLDRIAFVHGGLSDSFASRTIERFNERADDELRALLAEGQRLIAAGQLAPWQDLATVSAGEGNALPATFTDLQRALQFDPTGPAWYRGTAGCHGLIERPRFEAVLAARGLDRVVMGHTPTNPRLIQTRFEGRAVLADTGMYAEYYRGRPAAAIFSNGTLQTLTLQADGTLIEQRSRPPIDVRAAREEAWLNNVQEALADQALKQNETITFEANGRRLEAIWHRDNARQRAARLAAYELDKLLGFGLVAPVMRFEQNGRRGVLEVVPAATLSETSRIAGNVFRPNYCRSQNAGGNDYDLLLVLDTLIGQERQGDNLAYDRATWLMYLTEQDRAFPRSARIPRYAAEQQIAPMPLVMEKLKALNEANLTEALGEHLDERQIKAIVGRRDLLLAQWNAVE